MYAYLDKVTDVASGMQSDYKWCELFLPINLCNHIICKRTFTRAPLDKVNQMDSGIYSDYKPREQFLSINMYNRSHYL